MSAVTYDVSCTEPCFGVWDSNGRIGYNTRVTTYVSFDLSASGVL
jgi:hypothetical protein